MTTPAEPGGRRLSYAAFAAVVIVYLVIIQGGGLLLQKLADVDSTTTTRGVVIGMVIPLGVALAFVIGVVTYLGWWRPVFRDDRRVSRWVWAIPIAFVVAILIAVDYGALADKTAGFVITLLIATQLVGWGEELMFRGVGVTVLREHGLREGQVALWSSVIFGAVHLSNAIGHGVSAIPQALIVAVAGYFFYLIRRVSGTNALNSVLHGLFDFSLLSGTAILIDQAAYPGSFAAILLYIVLAVILIVRRRRIEPAASPATAE